MKITTTLKSTRTALCAIAVLAFGNIAVAIQFDATRDFSTTNGNPNGVWSYGYAGAVPPSGFVDGGNYFSPFVYSGTDVWSAVAPGIGGSARWTSSWVFGDISVLTSTGGDPKLSVGQLVLRPGAPDYFYPSGLLATASILRWTAPSDMTGQTTVNGAFLRGDDGAMVTAIRYNNSMVWNAWDHGLFSLTFDHIASGDFLDFLVYAPFNGMYTSSSGGATPLEVVINATPVGSEPPPVSSVPDTTNVFGLMVVSLAGLIALRRKLTK